MEVKKIKDGSTLNIAASGRIDTTTAPEFEQAIKSDIDGVTQINVDFKDVEYISSAGLRVLLSVQKIMNKQGKMIISHVNDTVMEILDVTGFTDILTIL